VTKAVSWLLLGLCAIIAGGGYYQVMDAAIFWCGRVEAFPGTSVLTLICLGQTALYLASAASTAWATPYRLSQIAGLPFLAISLFQVFAPHPRTVALFAVLAAIPTALSFALKQWQWMRPHLPAVSGFFVVSALCFLAAFGEIPFTLPGVVAPRWLIGLCLAAAVAVSVPIIGSIRPLMPTATTAMPDLTRYLPVALLLFPILRAKLPDIAYDAFTYKTTLPYQMAEWLTGDTAVIDGFMIGTNLQEILNALLVVLARDYLPPFISTISFVLLFLITPLAFRTQQRPSAAGRAVVAFAAVSAFVLSEAGIAQGTSHQEPMLLLFLVASLIRCPVWPAFAAVAAAVKINAAFIAPLVVVYQVFGYRSFFRSPGRLLIGVFAGAIVLTPQLTRNVVFSGRVLGMEETLSAMTDPPGPNQIMVPGATRYDNPVRGGILNNAVMSTCNIWLLSALCPMGYKGDVGDGFHVFPASRAPLFAAVFACAVLAGGGWFRARRLVGWTSASVFFVCYIGFLAFLSQGRYFLPLSFGFSVLLLTNPEQAEDALLAMGTAWPGRLLAASLGCFYVGSDLIPGAFNNVSWICKREVLTASQTLDLRQPETPTQRFLVSYVDRYKLACPPPGLPPIILAEHDVLNSPYLGTQRIFYAFSQQMLSRFFAANPRRQERSADAIIAVVSQTPGYAAGMLGPAIKDYSPCFHDDKLQVICSRLLAPAGEHCAASLYHP
jgi:hypothetical protein